MRKFSSDFDLNQIQEWHPELLKLLAALSKHCFDKKIPLHLTSGLRSKYDGFSKSKTHATGRGLDIRVKYWDKSQLTSVLRFLSGYDHVEKVGAISSSDGIRRIAYHHDNHLHLQVTP